MIRVGWLINCFKLKRFMAIDGKTVKVFVRRDCVKELRIVLLRTVRIMSQTDNALTSVQLMVPHIN